MNCLWKRPDILLKSCSDIHTLRASSKVMKDVCSDARRTKFVKKMVNFSLHALICRPPWPKPKLSRSDLLFTSLVISYWRKTGSLTPATLSVCVCTRTLAVKLPCRTCWRKSPAAYCACVREKNALDACVSTDERGVFVCIHTKAEGRRCVYTHIHTWSAILLFVLAISFIMSRNRTFNASDFFFSSSYPFLAPTRFVCQGMYV